jgi:hypothetical protein
MIHASLTQAQQLRIHRKLRHAFRRSSISDFSSQAALSTTSPVASYDIAYDRDTGIVWKTSSSKRIRPLFQTIIGIEIHAQLAIPTKLFSSSPTSVESPNSHVHPFDLGYPGTLPSLSYSAVRASIVSAAALNCTVHQVSRFERKHYFYPDLPAGYQVTQQRWPLGSDGLVKFEAWKVQESQKKKKSQSVKSKVQTENLNSKDTNIIDPQPLVPLRIGKCIGRILGLTLFPFELTFLLLKNDYKWNKIQVKQPLLKALQLMIKKSLLPKSTTIEQVVL